MSLSPKTKLGPYEITAPLGAGGMGEVYRAHDARLNRDVAIKVLPQAFVNDPARLARFQREAKVLASLNHAHIAAIYGLEDSGITHALVMELVEGPTLADRIRQGPIPIEEALSIAGQMADAIEYAHERGVVHRDLKPANVKVTNADEVKVLDFGLAKAVQEDASDSDPSNSPTISAMATQAGMILGTAAYMAPEQAKGKSVDRRADIWAFGCVLYEILTGHVAFRGDSTTDVLASVIRSDPDWSRLPPETSPQLRSLLRRCLQKDPRQRLQAIGDARIALDEIQSGAAEPSAATPQSSAPSWRRAIPWALFAITAAALVAFAWLHESQLRAPVASEPIRLQIPLPEKPPLHLTRLFALSPDGRQLAFAATSTDGIPRIYLRALDAIDIKPLQGTESVGSVLFWSPDSRFIAFDSGKRLQKIEVSGGPAETICQLNGTPVGGSWSPRGVIIFGLFGGPVMQVPASGGAATALTVLDTAHGDVAHTEPAFLPDGVHFLYLRDIGTSGFTSVGSLNAKPDQQDSRRLIESYVAALYAPSSDPDTGQLLFVRAGKLMAQPFNARHFVLSGEPVQISEGTVGDYYDAGLFSASANGRLVYLAVGSLESRPAWFDAQGKNLGAVGEPAGYLQLALSPDGARAAATKFTMPEDHDGLWMLDLARGTSTRFEIGSDTDNRYPVWSPDGRKIAFGSYHAGRLTDIYEKPVNAATDAQLLLHSDEDKYPASWSPDGRSLLYGAEGGATKLDLWVLAFGDHPKPVPFLRTEFNEFDPWFSPDGRWVAYVSDESGRNEVYVRGFSPEALASSGSPAGDKFLISNAGGISPRWGHDGKELYYLDLNGNLMVVKTAAAVGAFQAGAPASLFQAPKTTLWSPAPDGKRFLFLVPEAQDAVPFTVVLNWQSALKK